MVMMEMVMVMTVRAVGTVAGMMREAEGEEVTSGEDDKWQELKAENSPFHHGRCVGGTFQSKWYKSPTGKMVREAQTGKTNPWKWLNFSQQLPWKPLPSRENICKSWDSAVLHWQLHQFWGLQAGAWIISIIVTASIISSVLTKPCNGSNHCQEMQIISREKGKGCKTGKASFWQKWSFPLRPPLPHNTPSWESQPLSARTLLLNFNSFPSDFKIWM